MEKDNAHSDADPTLDVAERLERLMGDTGDVREQLGGFRIRVYHAGAFPWADVFRTLLYRDFRIYVTRNKADLVIEAAP